MKPLCIAHRGCHWECFENTKEAFIAAAKGDFYGIEMDIHLTKDDQWIIHHDPNFLSNGKNVVIKDENLDDLVKMPLDNEKGYKAFCPTLEEYLSILKGSGKRPFIEIKPSNPSFKNIRLLIKQVKKYFSLDDVTFIAFYPWPLLKIRAINKKQNIQLLVEKSHIKMVTFAYKMRWDLDVDYPLLTKEVVDKFKRKKLEINTWTVDDIDELKRIEKLDIDYLTTNTFDQKS